MAKGDERILRRSRRMNGRVAEEYIVEGEPGTHWRWADEEDHRQDPHLTDLPDGAGCAEIWGYLSEVRDE